MAGTVTKLDEKREERDRIEAAQLAEARRWQARDRLREFSGNTRQQFCGLPGRLDGGGDVTLKATPLRKRDQVHGKKYQGGFAGLFSCANIWTCPTCGVKIGAARAEELCRVMGHFVENGGTAALFTFTMRHQDFHKLEDCWDAIAGAWEHVTGGREWHGGWLAMRDEQGRYVRVPGTARETIRTDDGELIQRAHPGKIAKEWVPGLMEQYDCGGWDKNIDLTEGNGNGWHVHIHVVMLFNSRVSQQRITEFGHAMFNRWAGYFEGTEFGVPLRDKGGFDVQHLDHKQAEGKMFDSISDMAHYVSKGLAMETNLAGFKTGKRGNRTMMELLLDATEPHELTCKDGTVAETIDMTARTLFLEYERVSRGRKMNSSSQRVRELRKQLAPDTAELTAEELVEEDLDGFEVATIPRDEWRKIAARAVYLKQTLEYEGPKAAQQWLTNVGVQWYRPTGLTEHFRTPA